MLSAGNANRQPKNINRAAYAVRLVWDVWPDFRLFGRTEEYPQLPLLVWWAANIFFYGFGEEVGWRGFALPRLQKKYNALTATAFLSVFWTIGRRSMRTSSRTQHLPKAWV